MQSVLASDFARIPELLAREGDAVAEPAPHSRAVVPEPEPVLAEAVQLGLF